MPCVLSNFDSSPRPARRERGVSAVQHVYDGIRNPIIAALEAPDEAAAEAAAEAAVRQHLGKSLAIVDDIRERHPGFFL